MTGMVDSRVVRNRLRALGSRLTALRRLSQQPRETFTEMSTEETLAERHFQVAIQCCLDIGNHIIREGSDRVPRQYHEVFPILADLGVLDRPLSSRLEDAAGFRNVLVHMYLDVDPAQVYSHFEFLSDLESFARAVLGWLEREERTGN